MAKISGQKLKILYLAKMLLEESDEDHPVNTAQILSYLSACGISAERKSIYADLEELRLFGLDVVQTKGRGGGYFIGSREFELPEVRLLVDAVQSSRFLTKKKSEGLIRKLEGLVSRHQAQDLAHSVFVANRIKTMNESIYRNVDVLDCAIKEDRRIRFCYFEWGFRGEKIYRHQGEIYEVSPFYLVWDDENYYLIGVETKSGQRRHYRVDKMDRLQIASQPRLGLEEFRDFDPAVYEKKTFGMFNGKEESVTLWAESSLIPVFYDRFGDTLVTRKAEGGAEFTVKVLLSPRFYAWLMGFGGQVKILAPEAAKAGFCELCRSALSPYEKEGEAK